jgi:hypothetical protein
MNAESFPSTPRSFGAGFLEFLKALGRGLVRAIAYASCSKDAPPIELGMNNPSFDYLRLVSAIDHLTRPEPVLHSVIFNEPYIDRVNRANPAMLTRLLDEFGLSMVDVEGWRTLYAPPEPPAAS